MKTLITLSMALLLLSCADNKEKNTQDNKPDKAIILRNSSLSDQDLIKTKYDHEVWRPYIIHN